jgi:hypothetical protein
LEKIGIIFLIEEKDLKLFNSKTKKDVEEIERFRTKFFAQNNKVFIYPFIHYDSLVFLE